MLRNKTKYSGRTQNQENCNASRRPSSNNNRFCCELVFVPQLFPVASDYVSGNSTVAASQISWSHQSISNKAAFRKMFCFTFIGEETGVSRGCWCSPRTHNATFSFQGQRVLSVYPSYGTPAQSSKSKDVVNNNFRFRNFDAWIPEQQPGEIAKPNVDPDLDQHNGNRFSGKRNSPNYRKSYCQNRHDFARTGSKKLGIHNVSFTQSAPEVGADI